MCNEIINKFKPLREVDFDKISSVPLIQFLYALGEMPIYSEKDRYLYYPPYRKDVSPHLYVDNRLGIWYDIITHASGCIFDLAKLTARDCYCNNLNEYIANTINHAIETPKVESNKYGLQDVSKIPLTDFLAALGFNPPFKEDKNWHYYLYNVRYFDRRDSLIYVSPITNRWRDLYSGKYGDIYDLAKALTGLDNKILQEKYIKVKIFTQCKTRNIRTKSCNIFKAKQKIHL